MGEDLVMPYLDVLASFRDKVRIQAKGIGGNAGPILKECDILRDDTLPQLGVRLEDKEDEPTVIKLVNKEELMREKEERKRLEKEKKKALELEKQAELEAKKKIPPGKMFQEGEYAGKYSKFDDKGIPTHLTNGDEIPKSQMKKLQKVYQAQEKRYNEYLAAQNKREG